MIWLLETGKGEAATSAFGTKIDAYPRSCYITSEEGLLTVWCQASRGLYWIWIGSSPEFPQISFQYSKKKFKWNCFRFWVTRSITKLYFIPWSSTDCCNLSCCILMTIEISTDSEFDDDRDLYRFWIINCCKNISNKLTTKMKPKTKQCFGEIVIGRFNIFEFWLWAWLQHSIFFSNDFSQLLQLSKAFIQGRP